MPNGENEIQELYQSWLSNPAPAICVRLAGKLRRLERNSEALDVARKGLTDWPDNISVNVMFGRCALDNDLTEEATAVFEKVISIDPLNLIAIKSLGELHYEKGNWNRSIELFEEYLFEYPGDPEIEAILEKARKKKEESLREARLTGQDVKYPETGRMASILAAQKAPGDTPGETPSSSATDGGPGDRSSSGDRAPRSLYDLFTPEECEELGLSTYDK
jgi:predicted Zn-dependent protease